MATIAVFGSSVGNPGDESYEEGRRLGELLAKNGFAVATGGYGGTMEAVSAGAHDAGGTVIGVTAPEVFPNRPTANRFVKEHVRAASLTERIHELVDKADMSIALPGSIGTFTELMVAWNLAYVARYSESPPHPVLAVGETWRELVEHVGRVLAGDAALVVCVETVEDALDEVKRRLAS
jgi:uncharacterized protein (TIGR00725 family)